MLELKLLLLLIISWTHLCNGQTFVMPVNQKSNVDLVLGLMQYGQVSNTVPVIYHYRREPSSDGAFKVDISSHLATESQPLIVIIKRKSAVISWQIPLVVDQRFLYDSTARILCPSRNYRNGGNYEDLYDEMFIEVITLSQRAIPFSIQASKFDNFEVSGSQSFTMLGSPAAPAYVEYTMHPEADRILVKLKSLTAHSTCALFSIQSVNCPVGDLSATMRLSGRYQTVTSQGAIEVTRNAFPDGKFYIVLLVKATNQDCENTLGLLNVIRPRGNINTTFGELRMKTVTITVTDDLDAGSLALATTIPILVFVLFGIVTVILLQTGCRNWKAILCHDLARVVLPTAEGQWRIARLAERSVTGKSVPYLWDPANYKQAPIYARILKNRLVHPLESVITLPVIGETATETEFDTKALPKLEVGRTHSLPLEPRRKSTARKRYVSDIAKKSPEKVIKTSREYSCTLMTVFIFYSLPVLQLVMMHQALLLVTGNEDICFYNFSCSNRLGVLSDFNHIISNAGYMILGLVFLIVVRRRSVFYSKLREKVPNLDNFGISSQFGLFYGMGLALIMEGVMSACYHVCPSYNNFQFDTSFMYLLSGLLILKLYHSRHPDVLPRSYAAYAIFAGFIFIAVIGVVTRDRVYWILLSVVHGVLAVSIGLQILVVGYLEFHPKRFYAACRKCKFTGNSEDAIPLHRIVLSTLITLINIFFAISGPLFRSTDFASHLLFILQANLMVYAAYYMGMKLLSKEERISWMTLLYFLLALPAWIVGMYYFTRALSNWALSPALSREGNKDCFFFQFYDEHDVWHMLSAIGLFFTFMMLLNLDDDLATVKTEDMAVF